MSSGLRPRTYRVAETPREKTPHPWQDGDRLVHDARTGKVQGDSHPGAGNCGSPPDSVKRSPRLVNARSAAPGTLSLMQAPGDGAAC